MGFSPITYTKIGTVKIEPPPPIRPNEIPTSAMIIKVIVLILGAGGVATLWEAVIAYIGVALLAILNAVRIQRIKL